MGFLSYTRDVLRLLRSVPENPVAVHGRPWMGRGFPRFFWWFQVAVAVVGIMVAVGAYALGRWEEGEIAFLLFVATACGTGILFPLNLLLYASPWSDRERLEEIWLTTIPPRDVAFGSVFWSVVAGMVVPAGGWLAFLACVGLQPKEWFFQWTEFLPFALVALVASGAFVAAGACISLSHWLLFQRQRWRILLLAPATMFLCLVWTGTFCALLMAIVDELMSSVRDETAFTVIATVLAPAFLLVAFRCGGRLAVVRYWAPLFPEPLHRFSVLDCARFVRVDPARRAWTRELLRRWIPVRPALSLGVWIVAAAVLVVVDASFGNRIDHGDYGLDRSGVQSALHSYWNPWLLTLHYVLCLVVVVLIEVARAGFANFRIVPGRPLASLERRFGILRGIYVAMFAAGSWAFLASGEDFEAAWEYLLPLVGFALAALFVSTALIAAVGWVVASRRPAFAMTVLVVFWCAAFVGYLVDEHIPSRPFWHRIQNSDHLIATFFPLLWLACTLAALAFQRIHTRAIELLPAWGEGPFAPPASPR